MTDTTALFPPGFQITADPKPWKAAERVIISTAEIKEVHHVGLLRGQVMTGPAYAAAGLPAFVPTLDPADLVGAAPTTAQWNAFKYQKDKFIDQTRIASQFKGALIMAMDTEVKILLTGPARNIGLETLSIRDIMTALRLANDTLRPDDIVELHARMNIEFNPHTMELNDFITTHHDTVHIALSDARQALTEFQRVQNLIGALTHCGLFQDTIKTYQLQYRDTNAYTWDIFCRFILSTKIARPPPTAATTGFDVAYTAKEQLENPHSYCYLHGKSFHDGHGCYNKALIPPEHLNDTYEMSNGSKNIARPRPAWISLAEKSGYRKVDRGGYAGRGGGRGGGARKGAGRGGGGAKT